MSYLPDGASTALATPNDVVASVETRLTAVSPGAVSASAPLGAVTDAKTPPGQIALIAMGTITFLYFARPVVLPIFLACMAGMTLKPLIRWLSECHIRPALSAAVVLCLVVAAVGIGFLNHAT